jgi:hypothetical protein
MDETQLTFDDLLRTRAAVQGCRPLPPDVAARVLEVLVVHLGAAQLRTVRDNHILAAARLLHGAPWKRARALAILARRLEVSRAIPAEASPDAMLQLAACAAPLPTTARHYFRLLHNRIFELPAHGASSDIAG